MGKQTTKSGRAEAAPDTHPVEKLAVDVQTSMESFIESVHVDNTMTGKERSRLIGTGVRNYGFIDKAFDIARENTEFLPPFLELDDILTDMEEFEEMRQLMFALEQFLQIVNDAVLIRGDKCFRTALRIYAALREMSRNKVPGAQPLYEALLGYFRRRRRTGEGEPTIKELERDFHRLLNGTADGKLIIENESPSVTAGTRKIVDDVQQNKKFVKRTRELNQD